MAGPPRRLPAHTELAIDETVELERDLAVPQVHDVPEQLLLIDLSDRFLVPAVSLLQDPRAKGAARRTDLPGRTRSKISTNRRMLRHSNAIIASPHPGSPRPRENSGLSSRPADSFATTLVLLHSGTTFVAEGRVAGTAGPSTAAGSGGARASCLTAALR